MLSFTWMIIYIIITIIIISYLYRNKEKQKRVTKKPTDIVGIMALSIIIGVVALIISSRPRPYGADTEGYINPMNEMYFNDIIAIEGDHVNLHKGFNSGFAFFTIPAIFTGIRPIYLSEFTMRQIGVVLSSAIIYSTGIIAFSNERRRFSWEAALMTVLVIVILLIWESMYVTHFFYMRTNEAKAYCQFVLLPLAFSVFLDMVLHPENRKELWIKQMLIGFAAIPVATSTMTAYPVLVGTASGTLLIKDGFTHTKETLINSFICIVPNCLYILLYILNKNGTIII